jgi:uncharacterized protein YoxC
VKLATSPLPVQLDEMAKQCFCGCGLTVRLTGARTSGFGQQVVTRVDELIESREVMPEEYEPILAEVTAMGHSLSRAWQQVTHGTQAITGQDRLATEAFLDDSKRLLDFAHLTPAEKAEIDAAIGAGATADEVEQLQRRMLSRQAVQPQQKPHLRP